MARFLCHRTPSRATVTACLLLASGVGLAAAHDWPRFRGPTGQGWSDATALPTTWSSTENIAWRASIPGSGWSSPIVWKDRVFLTTATDDGRTCRLLALDRRSGRLLWDRVVLEQRPGRKESRNSYATPTPATDGTRVYVSCGDGAIAAVSFGGRVVWTQRGAPFYGRHGLAASLLVYRDLLITARDGSSDGPDETVGWQKPWAGAFVFALDTRTGRERWRTPRGSSRIGHATPIVVDDAGQARLVSPTGDVVQVFEARSGRLIASATSAGEGVVPSPIMAGGLIVAASGFGAPAVRAVSAASGAIVWQQTSAVPMQASPIYVPPHVYTVTDQGVLTALDASTGTMVWRARLEGAFSASPVYADGRLYFLNEDCDTFVVSPGPTFRLQSRNSLEGRCQASMAVTDGQIVVRTSTAVYAINRKRR